LAAGKKFFGFAAIDLTILAVPPSPSLRSSVTRDELSQTALIILGHGSTQDTEAGASVYRHAAALRARAIFKSVHEAFWKQEPKIQKVMAEVSEEWVIIVPLFVSEGYFADDVIPRALGFPEVREGELTTELKRNQQAFRYCRPIGTHEQMSAIILDRAREVAAQYPFPRVPEPASTTLFLAGHGTPQNPNSRASVEAQVERIRASGAYAAAHAVFLDESPKISEAYELATTRNLIMVPFFISNGPHVRLDIPQLLGEPKSVVETRSKQGQKTWRNPTERKGKLAWLAECVGTHEGMAEVILATARAAVGAS
jgi:sirohydrochlorin cobaltochelatase